MATGYGNFVSGSGYGWRVQVVVNVASETATTITYNVYGQFYNEHRILSFANGSVSGGGQSRSWDGSTRNLNSGNPGTTNFASYSVKLNKGSSARTETFSARFQVTGGYGNGTSNASVGVTVPAITYSAPNAPSNCSASRASDTQATVTWTNGSTSTTQPRTAVLVERQTDSGSWVQVASLSASATNYTDNGISADHRYAYRVRSQGNGGTSGYSTSGYIYTTPAAPSSVTAAKESTSSVTLSAEGLPAWAEGYAIERTADGGGSWDSAGTADTFPWTDASAPAGTIRYRVRSYRGDLYSAFVESNSITTITPPLAPTVQALPSVVATGSALTVQWTPNHPDGSAQEQAQVEYTVGSGPAQTATVQGPGTSYRLPAPATSSAGTVSVRVRTHGLDDEWGAWSAAQTVRVAVPPEAHFTTPVIDGAKIGDLPLVAEWSITDSTGVASQSLQLMDGSGKVLHSATPSTGTRQYTFDASTYQLSNATSYMLRLTVRGGSSLTVTTDRRFATSFAEPARPEASAYLDGETLSQAVTVMAGSPYSDEAEVLEVEATAGTLVPGLSVFGRTRQNLWRNPSGTKNGITVTSNEDGSVTVSGTTVYPNTEVSSDSFILVPGKQYTLSIDKNVEQTLSGANFLITFINASGSQISFEAARISGTTFTVPENTVKSKFKFYAGQTVSSDNTQTVSGTYRVMLREATEEEIAAAQKMPTTLQEGGTADMPQNYPVTLPTDPSVYATNDEFDWCPPGINGVEPTALVTAGKNLWQNPNGTSNGITVTANGDGTISLSGTATARSVVSQTVYHLIPGRRYALSIDKKIADSYRYNKNGACILVECYDSSGWLSNTVFGYGEILSAILDVPNGTTKVFFDVLVNQSESVSGTYRIMLSYGDTQEPWVPPVTPTSTAIDMQGHALYSWEDGTRDKLSADGTGSLSIIQAIGDIASYNGEDVGDEWLASALDADGNPATGAHVIYKLAEPQTVELGSVSMPEFPANPTTMWAVSDVPGTVRVDYPGTSSFTVQRVLSDGSRYTVATGLTEGQQALDRLPPLNVDFAYLVTAYAETGVSSTQELPAHVDSGGMEAFNFGRGASIALLMGYNASGSESADHGGTLYDFATGDGSLPLFYPTGALTGSASRSYAVTSREHANRVRALSREYPEAWFRDFDGNRMLCKASFSISLVQGSKEVRTIDVTMDECEFEEASNG